LSVSSTYGTGFMASSTTQPCPVGYPNGSVYIASIPSFTDNHGTTHSYTNTQSYTKQVSCTTTTGIPYGSGSDITSFSASASDGSGYFFSVYNYNQLQIMYPDVWLV